MLPWILDIDVTVKPLYGNQEGAEVGYNPHKPGRPSHVCHSDFVAGLRISLGVEVRSGNEHAAAKGLPGLWNTLAKLPRTRWPTFIRGDCGYGSESVMLECEERGVPRLFKLRHTKKVKALVELMMREGAAPNIIVKPLIQQIMSIAEQWTIQQRWSLLLTRLLRPWLGGKWLDGLPEEAEILLSGLCQVRQTAAVRRQAALRCQRSVCAFCFV